MTDYSDIRIFFCAISTKMTDSFDSLMGQAEVIFNQNPLSGHLFLFLNRRRDRIKILFWDRDGFCILDKRLEARTFQWPDFESDQPGIELTYAQLTNLLGGFDLKSGRRRRRYRRVTSQKIPVSAGSDLAEPAAVDNTIGVMENADFLPTDLGECHRLLLAAFQQTVQLEDRGRELSVEARRKLRRAEADPVLDRLDAYLARLSLTVLPKSALSKAVGYARNQWDALRCDTTDGRLTIDNNTSDRTLRAQAIGRKNWLFLGSTDAGPRAIVLYTILAGAKRHRLEPWAYVRELLMRRHAEDTSREELLPDRWAAQHPEAVLQYRRDELRRKATAQRNRHRRRRTLAKSR